MSSGLMVNLGSVARGLRVMSRGELLSRWAVRWLGWRGRGWWLHAWTPVWHEGRGPYLTAGLGLVSVVRGY